jgi:hypothetical protein
MNTHTRARQLALIALPLLAFAAGSAGCGREPCSLTGRVTFLGKPLSSGSVIVYCDDQQIVTGLIRPDGTYTIPNVPPGKARVTVQGHSNRDWWRPKSQPPPAINGPVTPGSGRPGKDAPVTLVPDRYGVPEESRLAVIVDRARTPFDIQLVP